MLCCYSITVTCTEHESCSCSASSAGAGLLQLELQTKRTEPILNMSSISGTIIVPLTDLAWPPDHDGDFSWHTFSLAAPTLGLAEQP